MVFNILKSFLPTPNTDTTNLNMEMDTFDARSRPAGASDSGTNAAPPHPSITPHSDMELFTEGDIQYPLAMGEASRTDWLPESHVPNPTNTSQYPPSPLRSTTLHSDMEIYMEGDTLNPWALLPESQTQNPTNPTPGPLSLLHTVTPRSDMELYMEGLGEASQANRISESQTQNPTDTSQIPMRQHFSRLHRFEPRLTPSIEQETPITLPAIEIAPAIYVRKRQHQDDEPSKVCIVRQHSVSNAFRVLKS